MTAKLIQTAIGSYFHWLKTPSRPHLKPRTSDSGSGRRLLVIEDDERMRAGLCARLVAVGFDVVQADNGHTGLSYLDGASGRPVIHGVLLDLQMPVLGGMAVLQELLQRQVQIPIIAMTDMEDIYTAREAIRLGAHDYLLKPFDPELLHTKCLRCFAASSDSMNVMPAT